MASYINVVFFSTRAILVAFPITNWFFDFLYLKISLSVYSSIRQSCRGVNCAYIFLALSLIFSSLWCGLVCRRWLGCWGIMWLFWDFLVFGLMQACLQASDVCERIQIFTDFRWMDSIGILLAFYDAVGIYGMSV